MTTISADINENLKAKLSSKAVREGKSVSELVKEGLNSLDLDKEKFNEANEESKIKENLRNEVKEAIAPLQHRIGEIEGVKSDISGLRTQIKDISERLSGLAEEKGVEEVLSECPECKTMVKPENIGEHLLNELKPKIQEELEPKIKEELKPKMREELKPKMREELKQKLKPDTKEVHKIPQTEFRKTIIDNLKEYRKDEVDKLKSGILEAEKILSNAGLIKSEGNSTHR